jgi:hypothetical protein
LSVQRQLTPTLVWQTAYFGSHGIRQPIQMVDNTAEEAGTNNYQDRQRWPEFPVYVNNGFNEGPSWYDGLSVQLRKTTSHNLSYQLAYTWSKTEDVVDSFAAGPCCAIVITPTRFEVPNYKGAAGNDETQRLAAS